MQQRFEVFGTDIGIAIGAGTGATTAQLLRALPPKRTEYAFTDISPLFVHQAAERFRQHPFVTCRVLTIEELPAGWSLVTDERGLGKLCLGCTRVNIRSIEAKLPEEWWE